ncbi:hypothetical protein AADW59_00050 [Candidatus Hodgkinia cicadicola]
MCKFFEARGFTYLDLPLIVGGLVRRDLTSAMFGLLVDISLCYKHGVVFRPERYCDLGRYRQFLQFDFDVFGLCSLLVDVCMVCYVYDLVFALECTRYVKCVLNVKRVLLGLAEVLGVLCYPVKFAGLLCALDKSSTLGFLDMLALLGSGRFDASGGFVPGLGMRVGFVRSKLGSICTHSARRASNFEVNLAFLLLYGSFFGEFGVRELLCYSVEFLVCGLLDSFVVLSPFFNRGLSYYTGVIFEVVSKIVLVSERNVFVKIGSLVGGGRFDYYVSRGFATGCSLGITRALTFLDCVRRRFPAFVASCRVCLCVGSFDSFCFESLILVLRVFGACGFSVKVVWGVSFATALRLALGHVLLLFGVANGWIVKLMFKRVYLQTRVSSPVLWRSLFIDQFWIASDVVCAFVHTLLDNINYGYVGA